MATFRSLLPLVDGMAVHQREGDLRMAFDQAGVAREGVDLVDGAHDVPGLSREGSARRLDRRLARGCVVVGMSQDGADGRRENS